MSVDEQPTLVIQGRVPPKMIHQALRFFTKQGVKPQTRSELVYLVFDAVSRLASVAEGVVEADTNHEALEEMSRLGMVWPGDAAQRDIRKAQQWDVLADLNYEDAMALKKQIMDQRKKGQNLMPTVVDDDGTERPLSAEEDEQMMRELEELDKKLRSGTEG